MLRKSKIDSRIKQVRKELVEKTIEYEKTVRDKEKHVEYLKREYGFYATTEDGLNYIRKQNPKDATTYVDLTLAVTKLNAERKRLEDELKDLEATRRTIGLTEEEKEEQEEKKKEKYYKKYYKKKDKSKGHTSKEKQVASTVYGMGLALALIGSGWGVLSKHTYTVSDKHGNQVEIPLFDWPVKIILSVNLLVLIILLVRLYLGGVD